MRKIAIGFILAVGLIMGLETCAAKTKTKPDVDKLISDSDKLLSEQKVLMSRVEELKLIVDELTSVSYDFLSIHKELEELKANGIDTVPPDLRLRMQDVLKRKSAFEKRLNDFQKAQEKRNEK